MEASKQVICGDGNGSNEGSLHDTKTPSELCAGEGNLDEDHEEAPQAGSIYDLPLSCNSFWCRDQEVGQGSQSGVEHVGSTWA